MSELTVKQLLRQQREEMRRNRRTNPTETPVLQSQAAHNIVSSSSLQQQVREPARRATITPLRRRAAIMPRRPLASVAPQRQRPVAPMPSLPRATIALRQPAMSPRITSASNGLQVMTALGVHYYIGHAPYFTWTTSAAAGHRTTNGRQLVGNGAPPPASVTRDARAAAHGTAAGLGVRIFASSDHVDVYCECAASGTPHCPLTQTDMGSAENAAANRDLHETVIYLMEYLRSRHGYNNNSSYYNNGGGRRFPAAAPSAATSASREHRGDAAPPLHADDIIVIDSDSDDDVIVLD